ncbi:MAG TPA: fumarylacetoacetase [Terracidiphilus sp.]|nr:fumarylacetoacetase [Terracidiphilus sp.]
MPLTSWITSANDPASDFPIQNLPYGVFSHDSRQRIGVAIGTQILDLNASMRTGLLDGLPHGLLAACTAEWLNPLMAIGAPNWDQLRNHLTALLSVDAAGPSTRERVAPCLVPINDARMLLPAQIGDYTDFYASIHHARRVGALFRPENPLLPNYKHIPIAYHGRASSIVASGTDIPRPSGQTKSASGQPNFGPSRSLDFELEVGFFIGAGNPLGCPISIAQAEQHIFGLCLVNDWSARDMQSWEYQPLGPFLAKSFATTVSPWVVPIAALAPYRAPVASREPGDPEPLPYLRPPCAKCGAIDLNLEVRLDSRLMRSTGTRGMQLSAANLRDLFWTPAQMLAHHTSNGCNLRPGDLLATGTVSGPDEGTEGCLLERRHNPEPICLPSGELRTFLEDGDRVTLSAYCQKPWLPRIGFGECAGTIVPAQRAHGRA